jgi:hypothetical protein
MALPDDNPGGYINASISHVEGFKNVDYLLAHGSGDDNVHYANSAHLLDMFTQGHVRNFRFRMFTDRFDSGIFSSSTMLTISLRVAITRSVAEVQIERFTSIWHCSSLRNGGKVAGDAAGDWTNRKSHVQSI